MTVPHAVFELWVFAVLALYLFGKDLANIDKKWIPIELPILSLLV